MNPATSMNQVGIAKAVQVLDWNNRILTLLGIWPSDPNNLRFTLSFGYMAIQLALEYADLFQSTNTFEHIVANLTQNITFTTIVFQVMLLRLNCRQLKEVIVTVREDFHEENYESCEERKVFLAYYKQSRIFFLTAVPMVLSTAITTYLAPLASVPGMKNRNETVKWNLPYHMRMFHDVSQLHSYALTYAAQLPFVFIASFGHTGPDCLIVTLILHVCGQLAVLGERIGNMSTDYQECGLAIEKCVRKHVRLIRMAKDLEESYNVILLVQLIGGTVLICILTYNVLANTGTGQKAHFLTFSLYVLSVLLLIYVYCFIGESLIEESTKVHHALTQCAWHEMPLKYEKMIIICMGRAQQPLILTAGKFYIFSMKNFTAILRTSMAYLSVLRSLL
ncbi:odorant receptor 13a-like [Neodiprion pinetum]|uniref:odorant receptor 13a-like n=1 Tax=Neodiprion pinetum TaxID=441929 RepID=UPI001EDE63C5|nr:odorant receptor 4-like [Neodiprion pinetum]